MFKNVLKMYQYERDFHLEKIIKSLIISLDLTLSINKKVELIYKNISINPSS